MIAAPSNPSLRAGLVCAAFVLALFLSAGASARDIRVGVYGNAPKIFLDARGKPAGILIELLDKIAAAEGWQIRYVRCEWQECLESLTDGRIDLMPDVVYTTDRAGFLDFHATPSLYSWTQIYARPGAPIASLMDLNGKRVAVLAGSAQVEAFEAMVGGFGLKTELVPVTSLDQVFGSVGDGEVDAGIANNLFGAYNAPRYQLVETQIVFQPIQLFYATAKGRFPELLSAIDRYLVAWQADPDSEYFRTLRKWRGDPADQRIPPRIWQALAALTVLLLATASAALLLRWRVAQRTRALTSSLKSLQQSQAQLRALFEHANDAIFVLDDEKLIDCNQRAESLCRMRRDEIVGVTLSHPSTAMLGPRAQALRQALHDVLVRSRTGQPEIFEWSGLRSDGTALIVEVSLNRMELAGDARLQAIVRDITERKQAQAQAQRSQLMLERTERLARTGSWEWDPHTNVSTWSAETYHFFGLDPTQDAPTATRQMALLVPEDAKRLTEVIRQAISDGRPYDIEVCIVRPGGERRYAHILGVPERDDSGKVVLLAGSLQDITDRKRAQERLQLAASVFTHAHEGITITDADGTIIDVNDTFTQITGYTRDEVLGQNRRMLHSGRQGKAFYMAMWHALTTQGHWSGEIWNRRKNGEIYAEFVTISAVRNDAGKTQHYVSLGSDVTASKTHQSELERIAHYDTLTGLPNRLLLGDRLRQAIAQGQRRDKPLAVVYLDLDNIKTVNDSYGHEAGDAVLIAVGQAMQDCLREGDTLARIGGDEFVAVLVDLDRPDDCIPVIERLLTSATTPVTLPADSDFGDTLRDQCVQVSASIGVTFYPQDDVDADVLLRHADQAMYLAKQSGKNRYHLFDIANDVALQDRRDALNRIGEALEREEFVLFYQPKVHMRTGEVIGAEALIRWQHPQRGLLPPGAFLPSIEDHPISVALGEWVIRTSLSQMSAWQAQGLQLDVSVNIGARQLQQADFPTRLGDILAAQPDVAPHRLQLEILETSALSDMAKVTAVMRACHALGPSFALDDFGTGYASLAYLKHLPAEVLKIDQSFIRFMADSQDDLAIVKGVVELAEVFHRQVIAEGVETKALGDLLLDIGCERAQGYGIARPMPAKDLPAWVMAWHAHAAWTG
ncbi:MAG: EAL domain-containing protein [Burkholderiaceae bacterium]